MDNFKKFLVYLLFIALFAALIYTAFSDIIDDLAENLRNGTGTGQYFLAAYGADGNAYALGVRDGCTYLTAAGPDGRIYERALNKNLPNECEVNDLFIAENGTVLLSVYERENGEIKSLLLYTINNDGEFRPLLKEPASGVTADERRRSVTLSSLSVYGGTVRFFFRNENQYSVFSYTPEEENAGLVPTDLFFQSGEPTAGIVDGNGNAYVAMEGGALYLVEDGIARQIDEGEYRYTRFMQADNGFTYVDARTGALYMYAYGAEVENPTLVDQAAPADVIWFAMDKIGGMLLINDYNSLICVNADGDARDLTPLFYREVFWSAIIMLAIIMAVLVLATVCWYAACHARKLYFPLALKNFLTLGLVAYLAAGAVLHFDTLPRCEHMARAPAQHALETYTRQLALGLSEEALDATLVEASRLMAQEHTSYGEVRFLFVCQSDDGAYTITAASGLYETGSSLEAVHAQWDEAARINRAFEEGAFSTTAVYPNGVLYKTYAPTAGGLLIAEQNGVYIEQEIVSAYRSLALTIYACMAALVLLAAIAFAAASRGIKRIARGVDLLAQGHMDVKVVQNSGDEIEALAHSVNDMAGAVAKNMHAVNYESASYMRFMPQHLVSLLDVPSVADIDRSSNATKNMAVMVVWFHFPEHVYSSAAQVLFSNINQVIESTSIIVGKNGGTVYNYTYEGFDAVFSGDTRVAVSTAIEIRQKILAFNKDRIERGKELVDLKIAIDTGEVMIGVVGDQTRMMPTAVSKNLNTARTLLSLCQVLETNILCTEAVEHDAKDYAVRYIGKCKDGGESIRVYELFDGDSQSMRTVKEMLRHQFSEGVLTLYSKDFSTAKRIFMDIARQQIEDGVTKYYLYLADRYEHEAPDEISLN